LRSLPAHRDIRQIDAPESALVDRPLQELNGRIEPVLLNDEQVDTRVIARPDQIVRLRERNRHRLFRHDVLAGARRGNALRRMQARRRTNGDDVALARLEQLVERAIPGNAALLTGPFRSIGVDVACARQCQTIDPRDRVEVVLRDPAAADESHAE
jgi:hypothetical protein